MMHNIAASTEMQIKIKYGTVQFHLDADVPQMICSDSCRILQVSPSLFLEIMYSDVSLTAYVPICF
jgi:hypothetical protein